MKLLNESKFRDMNFEYRMACSARLTEFREILGNETFVFERDGLGYWEFYCIQFTKELVIVVGAAKDDETDGASIRITSSDYGAEAAKAIDSLFPKLNIGFIDADSGEHIFPVN